MQIGTLPIRLHIPHFLMPAEHMELGLGLEETLHGDLLLI